MPVPASSPARPASSSFFSVSPASFPTLSRLSLAFSNAPASPSLIVLIGCLIIVPIFLNRESTFFPKTSKRFSMNPIAPPMPALTVVPRLSVDFIALSALLIIAAPIDCALLPICRKSFSAFFELSVIRLLVLCICASALWKPFSISRELLFIRLPISSDSCSAQTIPCLMSSRESFNLPI